MANPTFHSMVLTTDSPHIVWGSPQARFQAVTVPSVDGAFISRYGIGPRQIMGMGFLVGTSTTADLAQKALKLSIRVSQGYVNGDLAAFVDTDAESYSGCLLTSYQPAGPIEIEQVSAWSFRARCAVRFSILQQDPS